MSASPATHARLTTGAAALVVAVSLTGAAVASGGELLPVTWMLSGLGGVIVVVGLVAARPPAGPASAAVFAAAFVTTLHGRGPALDGRTPLVAAGLLLLAELVSCSAETTAAGARIPGPRRVPRAAILASSVVAAWAATTALVGVATLPFGRDLALTAAGATAVAAVVALLLGLAERSSAGD